MNITKIQLNTYLTNNNETKAKEKISQNLPVTQQNFVKIPVESYRANMLSPVSFGSLFESHKDYKYSYRALFRNERARDDAEKYIKRHNFNCIDRNGLTMLHAAAAEGEIDYIDMLAKKRGFDPNIRSKKQSNKTPLICAADADVYFKNTAGIRKLLEYEQTDVNATDDENRTALIYSTMRNDNSIANILLSNPKIDVNILDKNGLDALYFSIYHSNTDIFIKLLSHDDIDLSRRYETSKSSNCTILHLLCNSKENYDMLKYLLELHPDTDVNTTNSKGATPLICAVRKNFTDAANLLLQRPDIDVNASDIYNENPLGIAVSWNNIDIVDKLLARPEIDINKKEDTCNLSPIFIACKDGYIEIAKKLLARPELDINVKASDGKTPLIAATERENVQLVYEILKRDDVDLNIDYGYAKDCDDIIEYVEKYFSDYDKDSKQILEMLKEYKQKQSRGINNFVLSPENLTAKSNTATAEEITKAFKKALKHNDREQVLMLLNSTPFIEIDLDLFEKILATKDMEIIEKFVEYKTSKQTQMKEKYETERREFFDNLPNMNYEQLKSSRIVASTKEGFDYLMAQKEFNPNDEVFGLSLFERACAIDKTGELAKSLLKKYDDIDTSRVSTQNQVILDLIKDYEETGKYRLKMNHFDADLMTSGMMKDAHKRFKDFVMSPEFRPDMTADMDNNAIHMVSDSRMEEAKEIIYHAIKKGVDINSQNAIGQTPIMIALRTLSYVYRNEDERRNVWGIIKFMLDKGADVNMIDNLGQSVAHYACASKSPTALKMILEQNPNVHTKTQSGKLPKDYLSTDEMKEVYKQYMLEAL